MKFAIGLMPADHPDVLAALHKMRVVGPTTNSTAKAEAGYGQTFSNAVRADLAAHPGFLERCAPAQEAMHASHSTPAGVIIRAAAHSTANALQYGTNIGRMVKDGMAESPQASLDL
ncbi:hypothetical protein R75465_02228 [Paraburkholderia aspalathi]|uniref:hypothetical protein n=1 Tax=Paraburkholderia aspalathi TaxID=1324617 RepID=UPI001B2F7A39|nr:hypothetical protein [Paraburkholderia aspalathi]CAE6740062.1 hypothetical protein R75465_02228 [Paraburkholderia aspalathi]